jgi:hypothetical protein
MCALNERHVGIVFNAVEHDVLDVLARVDPQHEA